ncbi:MAG: hypothetical protein JWL59_815 [Chthoniobacteraceae bacterium]|nr:hypothetical protein [Chthoniobacteraceae bacterium]
MARLCNITAAILIFSTARIQAQNSSPNSGNGLPPPPPPPVLFPKTVPTPAKPAISPAPAIAPAPGPWKTLFDGTTISGFRGLQKTDFLKSGWKIVDGALLLTKSVKESGKQTGGDLITTEAYTDFEFSFEWKMEVSGNSGVLYLPRASVGQKPTGHEFQLIDDVRNPDGLKGGPIKRTGALYGILAPGEEKELNDGKWNEGRLVIQGNHVEHWINGSKVLEYELESPALQKAMAESKTKLPMGFGKKFKAPVMLLDQGEDIAFRNLKIRQIAPK